MRSTFLRSLFVLALITLPAGQLAAQGKGKGHKEKGSPPGHVKKAASVDDGIASARVVLGEKGYHVARVERVGGVQTIYYYRGNNGRGRGHGPLEKIVVRPTAERLVFEGGQPSLVQLIRARMGL